ncbi:MAG: hypothetical protein E6K73_13990 [Candidatus Eisenbacteria bacterium]|uniref:DUF4410 domain-containing protein n=1 Tax=Eiseniibacteriota bacterium TaxID=2212470 RepID=A0A538S7C7_UNCEI|nr:MAG: hypothetical protein E6K73_13990 [Candidatus Eisenbacteria bacterium]
MKRFLVPVVAVVLLSGWASNSARRVKVATEESARLSAPTTPLSSYGRFDLKPMEMSVDVATDAAKAAVATDLEARVHARVQPVLAQWNAQGANSPASDKVLTVQPRAMKIRIIGGATRLFAGALAGESSIDMDLELRDEATGAVIAKPRIIRSAGAVAGAFSVGATDRNLLDYIADIARQYLEDNRKPTPPSPHVAVAPTTPLRSSHTGVAGTWSGTLQGQQGAYPLTITFKGDGTYHATSGSMNAGSLDGTWQLRGGDVVWEADTTGRTGRATVQEANGRRTLRIVPDDGTYIVELTPIVPFDLRTWLPGNWIGSGGGYELTIKSNLTWEYTSTVGGSWFASGTARIEDPGTIVLEGWFRASHSIGAPEGLTMTLRRYGESLTGEFRLSRTWHVTFSRPGRPGTK